LVAYEKNFRKRRGGKYGLRAECRNCQLKHEKQYRENNKEEKRKYNKEYYQNNKDKIKECNKKYNLSHKKEISERNKKYRSKNRDKLLKYSKEYYNQNKEKLNEYCKEYRKENPDICFNNDTVKRLRKEQQGNGVTKEQWLEMMTFFDWKCAYSGERLSNENRTIDHIIPLNNGGLNEIWNCVPMLRNYNSSKRTNEMLKWYTRQAYFNEERLQKIYEWQEYAFEKWGNK
jgi:hypothetical protein